jgi:hypothetical protein
MSKQDYELLARAIRTVRGTYQEESEQAPMRALVGFLASDLQRTNERFDPERFIAACEVKV